MHDLEAQVDAIRAALRAWGGPLELDPARATIEPILNWGGFMNRSFCVADGGARRFVKVASDPAIRRGLERWRALSDHLAGAYHAPPVLGSFELPERGELALIFPWIEGATAAEPSPRLLAGVAAAMTRLHEDGALAARLRDAGLPVASCAESYLRLSHERFVEDLAGIEQAPPAFLEAGRLRWMRREAERLAERVAAADAFAVPADRPIHADLWLGNILVDGGGRWHLLDWDGLTLGDPATDWAMLFGPSRSRPEPASVAAVAAHVRLDAHARTRLELCARASLLDWVIDPLADWVEAVHQPGDAEAFRAGSEAVHRKAADRYEALFRPDP